MKSIRSKLLAFAAVFAALFDILVTAAGQPAGYWLGTAGPREGSLLARYLMSQGLPLAFLAAIAHLGLIALLMRVMVRPYRTIAAWAIIFTHVSAGMLWSLYFIWPEPLVDFAHRYWTVLAIRRYTMTAIVVVSLLLSVNRSRIAFANRKVTQ